jgi:hypothetical protein
VAIPESLPARYARAIWRFKAGWRTDSLRAWRSFLGLVSIIGLQAFSITGVVVEEVVDAVFFFDTGGTGFSWLS